MRYRLAIAFITGGLALAQGNNSHHAQNIRINNGISVQVNVETNLRHASKAADLDERGWMRVLIPANEPTPTLPDRCKDFLGAEIHSKPFLDIFLGQHNFSDCSNETCTVVAAGAPSHKLNDSFPLLSVKRVGKLYLVSADVYDRQGNIIVSIEGDKPHLNRNFVSDWSRPDKSTLAVIDNHNNRVLFVRLLNPEALYVEGVFNLPDAARLPGRNPPVLTITRDAYNVSGNRFAGSCMGEASIASVVLSE